MLLGWRVSRTTFRPFHVGSAPPGDGSAQSSSRVTPERHKNHHDKLAALNRSFQVVASPRAYGNEKGASEGKPCSEGLDLEDRDAHDDDRDVVGRAALEGQVDQRFGGGLGL